MTYADDTSIFLTGSNPHDVIIAANKVMSLLKQWVDINSLKTYTHKTKGNIFLAG